MSIKTVLLAWTFLGCAACTPIRPLVITDVVGPTRAPPTSIGALIVYSDTEVVSADPVDEETYSDYQLRTADDEFIRTVVNRDRLQLGKPLTVQLAAGRYTVIAKAAKIGWVNVPVLVEPGSTTIVDLNHEMFAAPPSEDGRWVRLPNRQAIGPIAQ